MTAAGLRLAIRRGLPESHEDENVDDVFEVVVNLALHVFEDGDDEIYY